MSEYSGPERRDNNTAFIKAIAKIEMVPSQIDAIKVVMTAELSSIKSDIKNLEEKVFYKVETIEEKLKIHCSDSKENFEVLDKHDRKIEDITDYLSEIEKLNIRVKACEQEIIIIKSANKDFVYQVVTSIGKKAGIILLTILGSAILFALFNPTFWATLLGGISDITK